MITHGHPTGYTAGCRGPECPHWHTDLMTCTEAHTRYQGDYAYRKAVDAGTATAEKYAAPKVVAHIVRETPKAAKKRAVARVKAKKVYVPTGKPRGRVPGPLVHGTSRGTRMGCKEDCPGDPVTGVTCRQKRATERRTAWARRQERAGHGNPTGKKTGPAPSWEHGTRTGAKEYGCKTNCPNELAGGISCIQASRNYSKAAYDVARAKVLADRSPDYKPKQRVSPPVVTHPHGTRWMADHGCVTDCPEELAGRDSCKTVRLAERAEQRRNLREKVAA